MAIVQGIRERLHLPIYDCVAVEPLKQLRDAEPTNTLKFFVNVQNKTKLETNLQSASLLPTYNTFEARALRVVLSDLPPAFPDDVTAEDDEFEVTVATATDDTLVSLHTNNTSLVRQSDNGVIGGGAAENFDPTRQIMASLSFGLDRLVELIREAARPENEGSTSVGVDDDDVELSLRGNAAAAVNAVVVAALGAEILLEEGALRAMFDEMSERKVPLDEQIKENASAAAIMNRILYNTVTSLYVGEKVMIQMPTWFFPAGAGTYAGQGSNATNGIPSPSDTFRFAEPIFIERQQNFRVEIEVPDAETLKDIQRIYGPMFIWVVLDGYMTRGVQ